MNDEESDRALEEVAEKLGLLLDQQVDARLEVEQKQQRKGG